MPIHYYAEFFCDDCGKGYGALVEASGGTPAAPPGWKCEWGAYLCPACIEKKVADEVGCVMCGDPVMEPGALICAAHDPGR